VNRTTGDARRHDRIAGALLGVHAGDSLGATLEFMPWQAIRARYPDGLRDIVGGGPFGWPAGHATDDSDLTRAVLLAYLAPGHADIVRAAADNMLAWLDGDWPGREPGSRPRDIGGATHHGLERYRHCGDPRAAGAVSGLAGNGSLMRCIPTALAVTDRSRRIRESIDIARIGNDTDTNAAIAGGLLGARDGASAIPQRWRTLLQFGDEFTEAAAILANSVA
jgi:ADP-ribosylglycohydrolase